MPLPSTVYVSWSISIPIPLHPRLAATAKVVPAPAKGSKQSGLVCTVSEAPPAHLGPYGVLCRSNAVSRGFEEALM